MGRGDFSGKRSKQRPKIRGKRDVVDEWEFCDIDRDEQKAGLKRREKRWREIQLDIEEKKELEKKAIENAEKFGRINPAGVITPLQEAWLRCDYVLYNIMEKDAYNFLEHKRKNDPDCYKYLYKIFMSRYMMRNIEYFVQLFANDYKLPKRIPLSEIYKHYRKYKGIRPNIMVKHKGEKEKKLGEDEDE